MWACASKDCDGCQATDCLLLTVIGQGKTAWAWYFPGPGDHAVLDRSGPKFFLWKRKGKGGKRPYKTPMVEERTIDPLHLIKVVRDQDGDWVVGLADQKGDSPLWLNFFDNERDAAMFAVAIKQALEPWFMIAVNRAGMNGAMKVGIDVGLKKD